MGGLNRKCIIQTHRNENGEESEQDGSEQKKRRTEYPFFLLIYVYNLMNMRNRNLVNTGDEVRVKEGRVWHIGRVDSRIKILGAAVHPHEVELIVFISFLFISYLWVLLFLIRY